MATDNATIARLAERLRRATETGQPIPPLRDELAEGGVAAAYAVQQVNTEHYVKAGRRLVGRKIGLTSKSVQRQLGVDSPDFGMLFADMALCDGEEMALGRVTQPKVEAEIALVVDRDLDRPGLTLADLVSGIGYALPAIEIVGSRIENWNIKLLDTVADNASSGLFVLGGEPRTLTAFDLRLCGMSMERRGEPVSVGAGAACLGNPLNAALWLARTMVEAGCAAQGGRRHHVGRPGTHGDRRARRCDRRPHQRARLRPRRIRRLREVVMVDIQALAARVDDAARTASAIAQLSQSTKFSLCDAYSIQKQSIVRRIARGERQVGIKMGFTSRAKMVQMGLTDMIWGRLTDGMLIEDGGATPFARYVHPRVEPEVAFLLKSRLVGRVTPMQALAAVEAVAPALELIDSRYEDFKFTLEDVVADNSSSSGFATGGWHKPDLDLANLGIVMTANGTPVAISSSAAILGNPLRSLAAAARFAAAADEPLQPGWIVMAGGATAAETLAPNTWIECDVQHLGRVGFTVSG